MGVCTCIRVGLATMQKQHIDTIVLRMQINCAWDAQPDGGKALGMRNGIGQDKNNAKNRF